MNRRIMQACLLGASLVAAVGVAGAQTPAPAPAQDTVGRGDGWVVLPVDEYRALRTRAYPPDRPAEPPPVDAVISGVDYDLTANGESASGQARLTIDVFKEGWVRVPMPPGLLVRDARIDGRQVALVEDASSKVKTSSLLLSQPGRFLLTLDVVVPIVARAGTEALTLPASSGALARAALAVPRSDLDVMATGGIIIDRSTTAQSTRVTANGGAGQPLVLAWARARRDHRAAEALRLRAAVTELVGLGEDSGHLTLRATLDIVQGVAPSVALTLPAGLVVNDVSGVLVSDWDVKGSALTVTFLEPVADRTTFTLAGEFRPPREGRVEVPLVRLAQAERETGGVAVEVLGAGELTKHDARGLDPTEPSDLGDMVAGRDSPALVAFRYALRDPAASRALAVTVSRYTPQAVLLANVDEARYRVLLTEDGKTLVDGRLAVRNNQRNFLGVTLPAGATLWSAAIDGREVRPGRSANGTLLLPLRKGRVGADVPISLVTIAYFDRHAAWTNNGQVALKLPAIDLPVSRTGVMLHHSPRFRTTLDPGTFRTEAYEEPVSTILHAGAGIGPVAASGTGGGLYQSGSSSGGLGGGIGTGRGSGIGAGEAGGAGAGVAPGAAPAELNVRISKSPASMSDADRQAAQERAANERDMRELNGLVSRYVAEQRGGRALGVRPVSIAFPQMGPMLYLAAELTPEGNAPEISLRYKREGN
jgi:hypothetical protein